MIFWENELFSNLEIKIDCDVNVRDTNENKLNNCYIQAIVNTYFQTKFYSYPYLHFRYFTSNITDQDHPNKAILSNNPVWLMSCRFTNRIKPKSEIFSSQV